MRKYPKRQNRGYFRIAHHSTTRALLLKWLPIAIENNMFLWPDFGASDDTPRCSDILPREGQQLCPPQPMRMLCRLPDYGVEARRRFGGVSKGSIHPYGNGKPLLKSPSNRTWRGLREVFPKAKRIRADIGSVEKSWAI